MNSCSSHPQIKHSSSILCTQFPKTYKYYIERGNDWERPSRMNKESFSYRSFHKPNIQKNKNYQLRVSAKKRFDERRSFNIQRDRLEVVKMSDRIANLNSRARRIRLQKQSSQKINEFEKLEQELVLLQKQGDRVKGRAAIQLRSAASKTICEASKQVVHKAAKIRPKTARTVAEDTSLRRLTIDELDKFERKIVAEKTGYSRTKWNAYQRWRNNSGKTLEFGKEYLDMLKSTHDAIQGRIKDDKVK